MRFLTFQPYDWKKTTQKRAIYDYLGIDAVYCINADQMDTAFINTCLVTPTIPELAVYFETDDFYLIDKVEQEKSTMSSDPMDIGVASSESYREIASEYEMSLSDYLEKYYPYKFEYVIDKKLIKNELTIDVCDAVLNGLDWSDEKKLKEVNKSVQEYQIRFWNFRKEKPRNFKNISDAVLLRSSAAYKYFDMYRNGSGLFFKDFKSHFEISDKQQWISDKSLREHNKEYLGLLEAYFRNPGSRTLSCFCSFVKERIYSLLDPVYIEE